VSKAATSRSGLTRKPQAQHHHGYATRRMPSRVAPDATLRINSIEAAPWRRSCSRTLRSPAAAASSPNRRVTYSGRSGSPFSRVNTSPVTRTRRHSPSGAADRAARPRATLDINALNSPPARAAQTRHARLSSSCPVRVRPFLLRYRSGWRAIPPVQLLSHRWTVCGQRRSRATLPHSLPRDRGRLPGPCH